MPKSINLITISNPTGGTIDCSGTQLQLRYANPDNTANQLSGTDWLKLVRFIRLWSKLQSLLGGDNPTTIQQTDAILAALYPAAMLPATPWDAATDAANRPLLDAGFLAGDPARRLRLPGHRPARARPQRLAALAARLRGADRHHRHAVVLPEPVCHTDAEFGRSGRRRPPH